ncbi:hypothetical protein GEMRC1_007963 [Eukaryota sp. GEM-RC1]
MLYTTDKVIGMTTLGTKFVSSDDVEMIEVDAIDVKTCDSEEDDAVVAFENQSKFIDVEDGTEVKEVDEDGSEVEDNEENHEEGSNGSEIDEPLGKAATSSESNDEN